MRRKLATGARTLLRAAVLVVSLIATTIALTLVISVSGPFQPSLVAATETVATAVLIVVTAAYVVLTRDLVEGQKRQHRSAARLDAVGRVLAAVLPAEQAAYDLHSEPLSAILAGSTDDIGKRAERLQIGAAAAFQDTDILPAATRPAAAKAAISMLYASSTLLSLQTASLREAVSAKLTARTVDQANIHKFYDDMTSEADSLPNPPWSQLEDRSFLSAVHEKATDLVKTLRAYQAGEE